MVYKEVSPVEGKYVNHEDVCPMKDVVKRSVPCVEDISKNCPLSKVCDKKVPVH